MPGTGVRILSTEDPEVMGLFIRRGVCPSLVRSGLKKLAENIFMVEAEGALPPERTLPLPGAMYIAWVPCFSREALSLLLEMGALREDFVECKLRDLHAKIYMHLPVTLLGRVNISRSKFDSVVSRDPFIANGVNLLSLNGGGADLPKVFRPSAGPPEIGLSDLIFAPEVTAAWVGRGLSGLSFKEIEIEVHEDDIDFERR